MEPLPHTSIVYYSGVWNKRISSNTSVRHLSIPLPFLTFAAAIIRSPLFSDRSRDFIWLRKKRAWEKCRLGSLTIASRGGGLAPPILTPPTLIPLTLTPPINPKSRNYFARSNSHSKQDYKTCCCSYTVKEGTVSCYICVLLVSFSLECESWSLVMPLEVAAASSPRHWREKAYNCSFRKTGEVGTFKVFLSSKLTNFPTRVWLLVVELVISDLAA